MHILICDDDTGYAQICREVILHLAHKHQIKVLVEIVNSGKSLLLFCETKYANADLIYLGHHIPDVDGIAIARELRVRGFLADIVFYARDETYAIDAYDVEALYYIVIGKVVDEKFEEIFLKAFQRSEKRKNEVFSLSCAGEYHNILIRDIIYFKVQNRMVTVYYYEEKSVASFVFYSTLSTIESFLSKKGFIRTHSAYLVAEQYVRRRNSREIEMSSGVILPLSRAGLNKFKNNVD